MSMADYYEGWFEEGRMDQSDEAVAREEGRREKPTIDFPAKPLRPQLYRGGVDDFDNPDAPAEAEDPRETLGDELKELGRDLDPRYGGAEPWPPSEEWTRRLRAVLAEVEGAQRSARGDDPPDGGQSLGLEVRGG